MEVSKLFKPIATGQRVVLKKSSMKIELSKLVDTSTITEKDEYRVWVVDTVGPQVKPLEWGYDVGDLVMIVEQPVAAPAFPEYVMVWAHQICAKFERIEADGESA